MPITKKIFVAIAEIEEFLEIRTNTINHFYNFRFVPSLSVFDEYTYYVLVSVNYSRFVLSLEITVHQIEH